MLDVVEVLQKSVGDKFRVGSLVKDTVRIRECEDGQALWGAVSANRRFQRVIAIVITIGGDEKQVFRLAFAPHRKSGCAPMQPAVSQCGDCKGKGGPKTGNRVILRGAPHDSEPFTMIPRNEPSPS